MPKAFLVYALLILVSFTAAGYEGYSASSLFSNSKHLGPGSHQGGHVFYSSHYHK